MVDGFEVGTGGGGEEGEGGRREVLPWPFPFVLLGTQRLSERAVLYVPSRRSGGG